MVGVLQRILAGMERAVLDGTSLTYDELHLVWQAAVGEVVPRELRAVQEQQR